MSLKSVKGRSTVIGPAKKYPIALPLDATDYAGSWAFAGDRMAYSDGVDWVTLIGNVASVMDRTVGPGGDYATLGEALAYFAGLSPTSKQFQFLGRITILDGTELNEQILMSGVNLGWVVIQSETALTNTPVNVNTFTEEDLYFKGFMPFMSFIGGSAPIIDCRFVATGTAPTNPDTSAPYNTVGLVLRATTFVSLDDGVLANTAAIPSTSHAFRAGVYNFSINIRVGGQSNARINAMEVANASLINISVVNASASVLFCRARGASTPVNIEADFSATVVVHMTDAQRTTGVNDVNDMRVITGGILTVGIALGGTSEAEIVPTGNGIVFDARIGLIPTWQGFIAPEPYTVATMPAAAAYAGRMIYVNNETGGPTVAFSDGTNWRRVQDRNVVN